MPWVRLVTFALDLWDRFKPGPKTEEPTASQRDIARQVAASETARQEGKRAATMAKARKRADDEDTLPGH